MEKQNDSCPKLTQNDRDVLKQILDFTKLHDSDIAKSVNISPQAVFKIRHKLEESGIIKGYMPIVDYKKIGINLLVILTIRLKAIVWEKFTDDEISAKIAKSPYVIEAYRISEDNASHILVLGFKNTDQKEKYIATIQTKFDDQVTITSVYTFTVEKIITQSPLSLLYEILNKHEFTTNNFFLEPTKKEK